VKTEHRLAEALKSMMSELPLEEISVAALARRCKVHRQTFYYHFNDIYDLLALVFLNEKIPGIDETRNSTEMVTAIYNYYEKNQAFIEGTLNSAGKDLFQEFVYNICYKSFMKFINNLSESKRIALNEKKNIVRFRAFAYSNSIVYYLSTHKNKSLANMLACFSFENDENMRKEILDLLDYRWRMKS
jgi:AcrR family transcriptional regulator